MVEKISAENAYVRYMMEKLPDTKKGKEYTIKRGDSLWNLAKTELNKSQPATNAEISKYMLLIAKLNGMETIEEMNNIKAQEVIYLPDTEEVSARSLINSPDKPKELNSAEQSFQDVLNTVLNDKSITIEQSYPSLKNKMYHVYTKRADRVNNFSNKSPVLSFILKQDGNVDNISFEDINGDQNRYGYDYDLTRDGKITTHDYKNEPRGNIGNEDFTKLEVKLKDLAANCKTYSF